VAYTTDQYNTLVAAIAQGALEVQYADKKVTYRSLNDMLRLKRDMEIEMGIGPAKKSTRKYAQFSTGLKGC
jgi:hypothetical protein